VASRERVLIMGAAGKDFHIFNTLYRDKEKSEVVAFTATQIPNIEGRKYPRELAGKLYPDGIPIYPEADLPGLIRERRVSYVVFAYSDVSHELVMNKASLVNAEGASFVLPGADAVMLPAAVPVVSICAVRTGCGKSQTARYVAAQLREMGARVIVVRHPMPYGDLVRQRVQRYEVLSDLDVQECTIEEREEYEHHLNQGTIVYAGVDYQEILRLAEKEADVILWDGGNNDVSFFRPDLEIVVVDPHRPGHELRYYPGEVNFRRADVIVINKVDSAPPDGVQTVKKNIHDVNPDAQVIEAASPITSDRDLNLRGKRVLVVEDGPTLTHGEMRYGAGILAARQFRAKEIIDPRPFAVGSIRETFKKYPDTGTLLPAMGYGREQIHDLEQTIEAADCDVVLIATPVDLGRILKIKKPSFRIRYDLVEKAGPGLRTILEDFVARKVRAKTKNKRKA
jgi:predicted GTPase